MDVSGTIGAILSQKSRDIFPFGPTRLVSEAIRNDGPKNVGALLVMDGDRLNGIISERDYTRKVFLRGKRSRETKVSEIMSTNVTVTHPREPVEKCLRLMTDKHIRHLPVVEGDQSGWRDLDRGPRETRRFPASRQQSHIWKTTSTADTQRVNQSCSERRESRRLHLR